MKNKSIKYVRFEDEMVFHAKLAVKRLNNFLLKVLMIWWQVLRGWMDMK
jgi:hypothetical protein